jgi:hypothetical protein
MIRDSQISSYAYRRIEIMFGRLGYATALEKFDKFEAKINLFSRKRHSFCDKQKKLHNSNTKGHLIKPCRPTKAEKGISRMTKEQSTRRQMVLRKDS